MGSGTDDAGRFGPSTTTEVALHPCEYCGTMLDEDDLVMSDIPAVNGPMLHSASQCREYVYAVLQSYKRELAAEREAHGKTQLALDEAVAMRDALGQKALQVAKLNTILDSVTRINSAAMLLAQAADALRAHARQREHMQPQTFPYRIEFDREDDGRWIAEVLGLPGCLVYGVTSDEAVRGAQALALRIVADRVEHGEADNAGVFAQACLRKKSPT